MLADASRDNYRRWPMKFRTGWDPGQSLLLPPRLDEWLPAGHLARVVSKAVDGWDLSTAENRLSLTGAGNLGLSAQTPVKTPHLWIPLRQQNRLRRISETCRAGLAFLWLSQLTQPKHSTIAVFRQQHSTGSARVDGASRLPVYRLRNGGLSVEGY